jgi:hypothetical protein
MKNCLKPALLIFLVVILSDLDAQIKSGYNFGLNLSSMTLNMKGLSSEPETSAGFHFGRIFEIPITGNFAFQPGLLLSAKGSDYKINNIPFSIAPIYIEIPVIVAYSFGPEAFKISIFSGPYFAYGVDGYKIGSGGEMKDISYGSDENDDLKPFDTGFNIGAGVNIKGFLITAQYGLGLANLSTASEADSKIKNKVIGVSFTSIFETK